MNKRWKPETLGHLQGVVEEFTKLVNPTKEGYEAALKKAAESLGIKNSDLIHPIRLAISGMGVGPGLYDILFILGKEESIRRINSAIKALK